MRGKRLVAGVLVMLAMLPAAVNGSVAGIDLLSQTYRITGVAAGSQGTASYAETGDAPLSRTVTAPIDITDDGIVFTGQTSASSSASLFHVEAAADGEDLEQFLSVFPARATAEGDFVFRPKTALLELSGQAAGSAFTGSPGMNGFQVSLVDLTTGVTIFDESSASGFGLPALNPDFLHRDPQGLNFRFDPAHEYHLRMALDTGTDLDDTTPGFITVSFAAIPAPGGFMLTVIGLVVAARFRRCIPA